MTLLRLAWISCISAVMVSAGCYTSTGGDSSVQPCDPVDANGGASAPTSAPAPVAEVPLRVEQFEHGELQLADVSPHQLEVFLRDLNQRRDYDYSQHNLQPGPNHEYLTRWITNVNGELIRRGYSYDVNGELHAPDNSVIPTR